MKSKTKNLHDPFRHVDSVRNSVLRLLDLVLDLGFVAKLIAEIFKHLSFFLSFILVPTFMWK